MRKSLIAVISLSVALWYSHATEAGQSGRFDDVWATTLSCVNSTGALGYCHCESCRSWSAGPVNAFSLWKPESLKVTHGASSIGTYNKTPISYRKWCVKCGGHLFSDHPTMGMVDIYAAMLPQLKFEPALHVNYQETVLRIKDGKPKMKDLPKEMGGSGITLPE